MRKLISILIMLSIMFNISVFSALSYETEAPLITSGNYYYIKNLQSGKYLDVEYANDSNGANVSQYHFTGNPNQKWRVVYNSTGGYYKLYPGCSSTRCLDVYTANGYNRSNIDIYEDSGNASRKFSIKLNSDGFSYRILTFCSSFNSAVTVSGASCNDGANVFQYEYTVGESKNDDWIFEPVNIDVHLGTNYATKVAYTRATAYPDLSNIGDCTNFASQCLLASGVHMQNEWCINKLHNNNPVPTIENINDGWSYSLIYGYNYLGGASPWISVLAFSSYWNSHSTQHTNVSANSVINNPDYSFGLPFNCGDVIVCKDGITPKHALYIVGYTHTSSGRTYVVASHTSDYANRNLITVAQNISAEYSFPSFEFYSMN